MKTIVLASRSPRRKKLLKKIGLNFDVHASNVSEDYESQWSAKQVAQTLAERKAKAIAPYHSNAFIIGADTIVTFNDQILEKPSNSSEAKAMLQHLSGHSHEVITAVSLLKTDTSSNIMNSTSFIETTTVIFGNIKPKLINTYVATANPLDKAGAYGIQDPHGALFVKAIEGDYYNVVGFPLHSFYNVMTTFSPELLSQQKFYQNPNDS